MIDKFDKKINKNNKILNFGQHRTRAPVRWGDERVLLRLLSQVGFT